MYQTIMDDVAYLFVEQYENIHGFLSDSYNKREVALIRQTADKGEGALYTVISTIFGDRLDQVLMDAAYSAMDYIAYVDETWIPKNEEDKLKTLEMERFHLESLKVVLHMAIQNSRGIAEQIKMVLAEAEEHYRHLEDLV